MVWSAFRRRRAYKPPHQDDLHCCLRTIKIPWYILYFQFRWLNDHQILHLCNILGVFCKTIIYATFVAFFKKSSYSDRLGQRLQFFHETAMFGVEIRRTTDNGLLVNKRYLYEYFIICVSPIINFLAFYWEGSLSAIFINIRTASVFKYFTMHCSIVQRRKMKLRSCFFIIR